MIDSSVPPVSQPTRYVKEILADLETPVSAYWKLAHDEGYSFLLESVTGGEHVGRYSIIGIHPRQVLRSKNGDLRRHSASGTESGRLAPSEDPLDVIREELARSGTMEGIQATFTGGAVGFFAYDIVRYFEELPDSCFDDLNVDDAAVMFTGTLVIFDHARNSIRIVADSEQEIAHVRERLSQPLPALPSGQFQVHPVATNMTEGEFKGAVTKMQQYVTQGDGVQFVPSQRFSTDVDAHPLTVYRALRSINPSPYMFLLRFEDCDLVGASPEILVSLHGRQAHVRPIAGTRPRGEDINEDNRLASELINDEKERAEHVMLVDLGRNDLGRVCDYGTVQVNDLMVIERYSHVMHIVSDVTGTLRSDLDAFDLVRACFPAGTVTGAPKIRAMEIIDELEPTRRGTYAGSVGFMSENGDLDLCIAIRTILMKGGKAYVQAGGGVVFDSNPQGEYQESCNKAKACLKAIELAQLGL